MNETPVEQQETKVAPEPIPEPELQPQEKRSQHWILIPFIIAILLVVFIPIALKSFREAGIRSQVSRVKGEQNMLATGLEAYFIDACVYPSPGRPSFREPGSYSGDGSYAQDGGIVPVVLTTPVAYVVSIPHDPFRNNGKGYYGLGGGPGVIIGSGRPTIDDPKHDFSGVWFASGWIISSFGPDKVDGNSGVQNGQKLLEELCWSDSYSMDTPDYMLCDKHHPLVGTGLTYDPTNGTISPGDVWRRGP